MSNGEWHLEPNAEREILLTWLDQEPDARVRRVVLKWLAIVVANPIHYKPDEQGVCCYAVREGDQFLVPQTMATWLLVPEDRTVVLVQIL